MAAGATGLGLQAAQEQALKPLTLLLLLLQRHLEG